MAIADQVKALLQSHIDGDDSQFYSIAMQLAAHEAKVGHGKVAQELRELIDKAKNTKNLKLSGPIPISRPRGELSDLLDVKYPELRLSDIILTVETQRKLERIIKEHTEIVSIRSHGLSPRKRLLLIGPSGTGKTLTASVIAGELGLPLFVVRLDTLITKFMGETASKLRTIFDAIKQTKGVYLFDEFDSIGSQRGLSNDVGEIRRVLNSFLQMIELDESDSILIAATNHFEILDQALYRRFDDIIEYDLPDKNKIIDTYKTKLATFKKSRLPWTKLAILSKGLSFGDITSVCEDAIKHAIINKQENVTIIELTEAIKNRQKIRK